MASRESWSDQFIEDFKIIYARRGRDVDCIEELRHNYRSQYPSLITSQLTRLRLKRKKVFDEAREEFLAKVKEDTSQRERHLLVKARDLNSKTVDILINSQEEYIDKIQLLSIDDDDYDKDKFNLLKVITSLQKEINSFSGLDFQVSINDYTQKLLRKKIIDEGDVEFIKRMLGDGGSSQDFGVETDKAPTLEFVDDTEKKDEQDDKS